MIDINSDNYVRIEDNIVVVKNFVTADEISYSINFAKTSSEEDWAKSDNYDPSSKQGPGWEGRNLIFNTPVGTALRERCNSILLDKYDINGFGVVHRMRNNFGMVAHHDDPFGEVAYGIVAYFNDEYEGGILRYVNKNIEYRPSPGDLIIHKAQEEYTHEVTPVTSGIRYYTTAFAHHRR